MRISTKILLWIVLSLTVGFLAATIIPTETGLLPILLAFLINTAFGFIYGMSSKKSGTLTTIGIFIPITTIAGMFIKFASMNFGPAGLGALAIFLEQSLVYALSFYVGFGTTFIVGKRG